MFCLQKNTKLKESEGHNQKDGIFKKCFLHYITEMSELQPLSLKYSVYTFNLK